ncbi:NAD(P)H-dependent oxidoreductase [Sulfurirhabdus autotrophica]|uniref:Nitroreductase n=1 Tax=Sulfurirhabdus autotrophica TaxID=1706046 RepID=A0A4R3YGM6_9PROT|nr:NAD(P)H-dependent oxidoreductase [Sulfurirhabdus autotrophica]TCV90388.1 nitroreductase [Sulfurirhabdus autotrophica]
MIMKNALLDAFYFRHACKLFDDSRKIPQSDLDFILEAGRLSPSSMGLEHWKFIVVQSPQLKVKLRHACSDQPQISSSSDVIVILAKISDLQPDSAYVIAQFSRLNLPPDKTEEFHQFYREFVQNRDLTDWSVAQCHIAAANMMTAAAAIGIDSCPIGAFGTDQVRHILQIDHNQYEVALVLPIGYRKHPQPAKHRLAFSDLIEFR